jgi:Tfp pilus assembly protein PilN
MMQATAGVQVSVASPLSSVDLSDLPLTHEPASDVDGVAAAPIGLALPDPTGRPFNLLPESVLLQAQEKRLRKYLVRAAAVVVVLIVGLTGLRFFQVHSAQSRLNSVEAENATIRNVEIPKYDKALVLRDQVVRQSSQVLPVLQKEVDWLVVLNQIAQYIPPTAALSSISLTATSIPGQLPAQPAAGAIVVNTGIGTVTTSVVAKALTDVTAWGHSLTQSPVFNNVDLTSGVSNSTGVNFSATLSILNAAHSHRLAQYTVPS